VAGRVGRLAVTIAVLVIALAVALFPSGAQAVSYSSQEIVLVQLLNEYRQGLGLQPLMVSDLLSDAAERHSSDMGKYAFFNHYTEASDWFAPGSAPWDRMAVCGYTYNTYEGENIAAGDGSASGVIEAWKNSGTHNRAMTSPDYTVVGVGLVYVSGSQHGSYWTLDFGGYKDPTAHWLTGDPTTTTTEPPTTTTSTTVPSTTTTTLPGGSTTSTTVAGGGFPDVPPEHSFYGEITGLAAAGVVSGCIDGLFHPDDLVTRAQFAKIIVLALGEHTAAIESAGAPTFPDVPFIGSDYPFDYVEEAVGLGIIEGYANGRFGPGDNVTRAQLALMLVRAGGNDLLLPPAGYPCPFVDVPGYARDAVTVAYYNGLVSGKTAATFAPYSPATRGHVAKMVYGLREVLGF